MASTFNNFALLNAAQQAEAAAGKKKRRNNKKKGAAAPPLPPSILDAPAFALKTESPFLGTSSGASFGGFGSADQPDDAGFRVAGRSGLRSRSASTSSLTGANGDTGSPSQDFIEATLEQAVAASMTAEARRSLQRQWLNEVDSGAQFGLF